MIKPLGDRILVEVLKSDKKGKQLIMNEKESTKPYIGKVVALGEEISDQIMYINGEEIPQKFKRCRFDVGDIVYFRYFMGFSIFKDKTEYLILNTSEILGMESNND